MSMVINDVEFRENLIKYKNIVIEHLFKNKLISNEYIDFNEYSICIRMYPNKDNNIDQIYFAVDFKKMKIENEQNLIDIFIDEFRFCEDIEFFSNSKVIALYGRKDEFFIELRKYKLKLLEEYGK